MGYYTNFTLSASRVPPAKVQALQSEVDRMSVFEDYWDDTSWSAYTKWYDWEQDMLLLSARFPGVLFQLDGDGEESGDIWRAYFMSGKMQYESCHFFFGEFDEEKMKPGVIDNRHIRYSYEDVSV